MDRARSSRAYFNSLNGKVKQEGKILHLDPPPAEYFAPKRKSDGDSNVDTATTSSREQIGEQAKRLKSGVDLGWKKQFPWLEICPGGAGMLCNICSFQQRRRQGGVKVWSEVPCTTIERASLTRHAKSAQHQEASALAAVSEAAENKQVDSEQMMFLAALKGMYWLIKNEISCTTNFASLLDMMCSLGVSCIAQLDKDNDTYFTSEEMMWEMAKVLSDELRQQIFSCMRNSPYFSLMIDETNDITVAKQLIIFGRYLSEEREVRTSFLGIRKVANSTADTISENIKEFLNSIDVNMTTMAGFGSDGAPVMVRNRNGVAAKLRATNRKLVNVHCIAHRLALATAQAAGEIPYLVTFKDLLGQLYRFYEHSSVQMSGLKDIQAITSSKDDCVNLIYTKDMRWLSHNLAVGALRRTFDAVVTNLEREATERNDVAAKGLTVFLKTFNFSATLLMMSDVLPLLAKLSKVLQKQDLDFSHVDINVDATLDALKKLKATPGIHFQGLKTFLDEVARIHYSEQEMERFVKDIYRPFIDNIINNLQDRFPDSMLMSAFNVFDPTEADLNQAHRLELLCEHYSAEVSPEEVHSEYRELSFLLLTEYNSLSVKQVLKQVMVAHADTMPNLAKLAAAIAVIPVSTADCEGAFSTMKRVKTSMSNDLKEEMLDNLLMISIQGPATEDFTFDSACVRWAAQRKKRQSIKQ